MVIWYYLIYSLVLKLYVKQEVGNIMNKSKRMTASDLKFHYEQAQGGHFFDRGSMKFFGDTMANFGVRAQTEFVKTYSEEEPIECYVLYRRKKTSKGLYKSAYFACSDFKVIHKAD